MALRGDEILTKLTNPNTSSRLSQHFHSDSKSILYFLFSILYVLFSMLYSPNKQINNQNWNIFC
jgi:hypothetical protein